MHLLEGMQGRPPVLPGFRLRDQIPELSRFNMGVVRCCEEHLTTLKYTQWERCSKGMNKSLAPCQYGASWAAIAVTIRYTVSAVSK